MGAAAGAGLSLVGGLIGSAGAAASGEAQAKGAMFQAYAAADSARFNAGQEEFLALVAERNRDIVRQQVAADVEDQKVKHVAQLGQIRVAYGANGLAMEGSPLDVLEATAIEQNLDIAKTLYQGEITEAGLTDEAAQRRAQASMLRWSADNYITAGGIAASGARTAASYQSAASIISGFGGAARSLTSASGEIAKWA